jgi:hypothetical protein
MNNEQEPDAALPPGVVSAADVALPGDKKAKRSADAALTRVAALTPVPSPKSSGFAGGRGVPAPEGSAARREAADEPVSGTPSPVARGKGGGPATELSHITALEPQQKHEGRTNVFVDGKFALGLFDEVVLALGLHVGQTITPGALARDRPR